MHIEVSRFCKIIRESVEFSREEMVGVEVVFENDDDNEDGVCRYVDDICQNDYDSVKKEVVRIL